MWVALRRALPDVHWQRIEGSPGVPDINGCWAGADFWIEGKVLRAGHKIRFQPGQVGWLLRRAFSRGRCFVLVVDAAVSGDWLLYHGAQVRDLALHGVGLPNSPEPLLRLPKPRKYDALLRVLVT